MSEADSETFVIKTPIGDCEIPFNRDKIVEFLQEAAHGAENRKTIFGEETAEFLGVSLGNEDEEYEWWEENHVPSLLYDLNQFIHSEYEGFRLTNYNRRGTNHSAVVKKNLDYPHGKESVVIKGTYYLENKDGMKFVLTLNPVEGLNIEVRISYDSSVCSPSDFMEPFMKHHHTKGILKNSSFNSKMEFLKYDEKNWEDIILTEHQRKKIDRNITKFVENMEKFKSRELPLSRGILVVGPPGTGKTLLCNTIMSQTECTFIYITSESVSNRGDISDMYDLARSLSPSIIVVEDIDTLGAGDREQYGGDHPLLGEFLNCLAGIEKNEQVITIATTNYPQHLDKALVDRPGRFDVRIDFGLPDETLRETIFNRYLKSINHEKISFSKLIKITEGMSGAHLKEIVMMAYMEGLEENNYDENFKLKNKLLFKKAEQMKENRSKYKFHAEEEERYEMHN